MQAPALPPTTADRIVAAIKGELLSCPSAAQAARGGTLVVIVKLDSAGQPKQIQLKIDGPRSTVTRW